VLALAVVHIAAISGFRNTPPVVVVAKQTLAHVRIGPSHMYNAVHGVATGHLGLVLVPVILNRVEASSCDTAVRDKLMRLAKDYSEELLRRLQGRSRC